MSDRRSAADQLGGVARAVAGHLHEEAALGDLREVGGGLAAGATLVSDFTTDRGLLLEMLGVMMEGVRMVFADELILP